MRTVRVETLDAFRSSAGGGTVDRRVIVPALPVARERTGEPFFEFPIALQLLGELGHSPGRLEPAQTFDEHGARQPVERWKGRSVLENGMVLNHHGDPEMASAGHRPAAARRTAELRLDECRIRLGVLKHPAKLAGQLMPMNPRKPSTKPGSGAAGGESASCGRRLRSFLRLGITTKVLSPGLTKPDNARACCSM